MDSTETERFSRWLHDTSTVPEGLMHSCEIAGEYPADCARELFETMGEAYSHWNEEFKRTIVDSYIQKLNLCIDFEQDIYLVIIKCLTGEEVKYITLKE